MIHVNGHSYNIPENIGIAIAGTVGIGKSTLTKVLANYLNLETSFERVEDNPYLDRYYSDFSRWGFHLQIYFLAERFKEQKRLSISTKGYIQDRSIYEDIHIFAQMNYDTGAMTFEDFKTYSSLFEAMVMTPYFPHPDLVIYLEGNMDTILQRITTRGRESEKKTDPSYWYELQRRYNEWIQSFTTTKILKLNVQSYDLIHNEDDAIHFILSSIETELNSTKSIL